MKSRRRADTSRSKNSGAFFCAEALGNELQFKDGSAYHAGSVYV